MLEITDDGFMSNGRVYLRRENMVNEDQLVRVKFCCALELLVHRLNEQIDLDVKRRLLIFHS